MPPKPETAQAPVLGTPRPEDDSAPTLAADRSEVIPAPDKTSTPVPSPTASPKARVRRSIPWGPASNTSSQQGLQSSQERLLSGGKLPRAPLTVVESGGPKAAAPPPKPLVTPYTTLLVSSSQRALSLKDPKLSVRPSAPAAQPSGTIAENALGISPEITLANNEEEILVHKPAAPGAASAFAPGSKYVPRYPAARPRDPLAPPPAPRGSQSFLGEARATELPRTAAARAPALSIEGRAIGGGGLLGRRISSNDVVNTAGSHSDDPMLLLILRPEGTGPVIKQAIASLSVAATGSSGFGQQTDRRVEDAEVEPSTASTHPLPESSAPGELLELHACGTALGLPPQSLDHTLSSHFTLPSLLPSGEPYLAIALDSLQPIDLPLVPSLDPTMDIDPPLLPSLEPIICSPDSRRSLEDMRASDLMAPYTRGSSEEEDVRVGGLVCGLIPRMSSIRRRRSRPSSCSDGGAVALPDGGAVALPDGAPCETPLRASTRLCMVDDLSQLGGASMGSVGQGGTGASQLMVRGDMPRTSGGDEGSGIPLKPVKRGLGQRMSHKIAKLFGGTGGS